MGHIPGLGSPEVEPRPRGRPSSPTTSPSHDVLANISRQFFPLGAAVTEGVADGLMVYSILYLEIQVEIIQLNTCYASMIMNRFRFRPSQVRQIAVKHAREVLGAHEAADLGRRWCGDVNGRGGGEDRTTGDPKTGEDTCGEAKTEAKAE